MTELQNLARQKFEGAHGRQGPWQDDVDVLGSRGRANRLDGYPSGLLLFDEFGERLAELSLGSAPCPDGVLDLS